MKSQFRLLHTSTDEWQAPDINNLPDDEQGKLIRYGHELISNTSLFFGPKGNIASITNGMNCANCHIDAGAKSFGGSFSAVASPVPAYSGTGVEELNPSNFVSMIA